MALNLIIADETTHFSVTDDTNVIRRFPKNSVLMDRNEDRFLFVNGGDNQTPLKKFNTEDVTTPAHAAVVATGTLTASTILTTETITIGTTVYRFMTSTAQAYDVLLGANDAAALDNLKLAINASGTGDGSDYHAGTLIHPDVTATTNTDTTQVVDAKVGGTDGNAIVTTDTGGGTSLTWAAVTLTGGELQGDVLETALYGIIFK